MGDLFEALRDLDYLQERAKGHPDNDSFYIISASQIERDILKHAGLIPHHMDPSTPPLSPASDADKPQLGWQPLPMDTPSKRLRLSVAIAGALSLLIPTLIIVLVPGRAVPLITASVAILVVAVTMGLSTLEIKTVLAVTAGYASVMIVFVGTLRIPYYTLS